MQSPPQAHILNQNIGTSPVLRFKMTEKSNRGAVAEGREIAEDRGENFRGTVKVRLRRLIFPPKYSREINRKNVERLRAIFRKPGGCLRLTPSNCIPAIISQQDLDRSIKATGTSLEELLDSKGNEPPMLKLPDGYSLRCLNGQHRVLAALEALRPKDEWWSIHLYLSGILADVYPEVDLIGQLF